MTDKLTITFKPKQAVKRLLGVLGDRSQDVLTSRFGLGADTKRMTLEAIGKKYKITRERVRQIENYSLINIRKSKEYTKEKEIFDELREIILNLGSTVGEETLLKHLSKDKSTQNQIHFLLVVGEDFTREKEDDEFKHRWTEDKELAKKIHNSLRLLYSSLSDNEILKDSRFVLVGRGLYALSEWGYMSGVVRDVIKAIIEKHGPMTKDEIVKRVLKERYVKENTIMVNLQNSKFFKKSKDGKYSLV